MYQTNTMVPASTLAEALPDVETALKIAREIGLRSGEAYSLAFMGFCLGPAGEYGRALDMARAGLRLAEEIEHRQWAAAAHCGLSAIYLDLFALPEARRHGEQALAIAREISSMHWVRTSTGYLGASLVLQNELAPAGALIDAALPPNTPAQTLGQRRAWAARAELSLALGDAPAGLQIAERLIASANAGAGRVVPYLWRLRGRSLARLGRYDEAEVALREGSQAAEAQGIISVLWRFHLDLGKLYAAQSRRKDSRNEFLEANRLINSLAANVPDANLREGFLSAATAMLPAALLAPATAGRAAKEKYGGLTAREREVAALIAQGKSNRDIAASLVLGKRTVETHVSDILSKLGFTSRSEIAVWASQQGLG